MNLKTYSNAALLKWKNTWISMNSTASKLKVEIYINLLYILPWLGWWSIYIDWSWIVCCILVCKSQHCLTREKNGLNLIQAKTNQWCSHLRCQNGETPIQQGTPNVQGYGEFQICAHYKKCTKCHACIKGHLQEETKWHVCLQPFTNVQSIMFELRTLYRLDMSFSPS